MLEEDEGKTEYNVHIYNGWKKGYAETELQESRRGPVKIVVRYITTIEF